MRILHVITALGLGGCERMLTRLLHAKALASHEQRVVTLLPGGALTAAVRDQGTAVDELDFLGPIAWLRGRSALQALARQFDPGLIQGWMYHGNLGATLAQSSLRRRVPLAWGIRQSLATLQGENLFARIGIALNRWGSSRPDCVIFNSATSMSEHAARGFDVSRGVHLPNGFDSHAFAPDPAARRRWRATWGAGDDCVVFGLFARFHPAKDHGGFLAAAGRVRKVRADVRFVLAGTGVDPGNAMLTAAIDEHGLRDCVQLLGPRSDVAELMAAMDVYVSSSSRLEAFSNSIGEAMSCGLPCVVTAIGDSPDIVGECGLVVPPGDAAALAHAMQQMVTAGALTRQRLGASARRRVVENYDLESVARRYAALYERLRRDDAVGRG